MDNASLRDFQGGEGTYVANALERTLLLPTDMAELKHLPPPPPQPQAV